MDEQWAMLEPLLPIAALGRPMVGRRRLIDGVRWRVRTGAPWRDLPREYGPWQTVFGFFRRWQRDGTWSALFTRLQARADAAGLLTWEVNVDSTICPVYGRGKQGAAFGYTKVRGYHPQLATCAQTGQVLFSGCAGAAPAPPAARRRS